MSGLAMAGARGRAVRIRLGERTIEAHEGETVGAALLAAGVRRLRSSPVASSPRGLFCFMGACQECLVLVGGRRVTSCTLPVSDGLRIDLIDT